MIPWKKGVNDLNVVLNELDSIGKYTFQELINIISYIAIIEEFNYPKISRTLVLQGTSGLLW